MSGRPRAGGSPPPRTTGGLEHINVHAFPHAGQRVQRRAARARSARSHARRGAHRKIGLEEKKARQGLRLTGPGRGACDPPANRTPLTAHRARGRRDIHLPLPIFGRTERACCWRGPARVPTCSGASRRPGLCSSRIEQLLRPISASGRREAPALSSRRTQELRPDGGGSRLLDLVPSDRSPFNSLQDDTAALGGQDVGESRLGFVGDTPTPPLPPLDSGAVLRRHTFLRYTPMRSGGATV